MAKLKTWSYSAATTFEKCPRQYYHLYVAKDVKTDPNQQHFLYGNEVHKAAELHSCVTNIEPMSTQISPKALPMILPKILPPDRVDFVNPMLSPNGCADSSRFISHVMKVARGRR